jgi:hypothetical protein
MSTPNVLLPQGGLNAESIVYILGWYQSELYAMTSVSTQFLMSKVYTNASLSQALSPTMANLTPFTLNYNGDAIVLQGSNSRYLVPNANVLTSSLTQSTTEPIFMSQGSYTRFSDPSILLSSVPYKVYGGSNSTNLTVRLDDNTTVSMMLMFVPVSFFTGCTAGNNEPIVDTQSIMNVTYCSHENQTWCSTVAKEGWVEQSDCLVGNTYTYCVNGVSCNGNCNSGCFNSIPGSVCTFNGNQYECVVPEAVIVVNNNNLTTTTTDGTSWWVILIIITIIIFVVILIAFAYRYQRRPTIDHHEYHETYGEIPPHRMGGISM